MKKHYKVVFIGCILFTLCFGYFLFHNTIVVGGFISRNGEHYIYAEDKYYKKAINYLIKENEDSFDPDKSEEKYHFFITYDGFGMTEKDEYKYAYMWVLGESHYLKDGEIKDGSAYSVFHKFKFKDGEVVSYEVPKDGSYYTKSIKEMCIDSNMSRKVLNYNLKLSLDKEVKKFYK